MGHSMGSGIAALMAASVPERVAALAMLDGLGPLSGDPADEPDRLAAATRQMSRHAAGRRPPVYPDRASAVAARVRSGGIDPHAAGLLVDRALAECPGGFTWSSDPRLLFRSPCYLTEPQVLAFLGRVACPSLLLEASDGVLNGRPEIAGRRRALRRLEHHVLAGGHHLHLETPELVLEPLQRFFTRL
jgi:pimeloyl-ACP methyl ester carboxylesterase